MIPDAIKHLDDAPRPVQMAREVPRAFLDATGRRWSVHEIAAGAVPWARGPRCLLFGCDTMIRRVWQYPPDWHALSDTELEVLSWQV